MFKTALVLTYDHWEAPSLPELEARLQAGRFVPGSATQAESTGWVEPRGEAHAPLAESVGGQWLLLLCTETRAVPGAAVKTRLDEALDAIERDTGRRPKGKAAKEVREAVVHELLPRAFPKRTTTRVWIDAAARRVVIGTSSAKKADAIVTRLHEALSGGIALRPLQTALAPATAMAAWLSDKEAPAGFSIDRECELKQPDSDKAAVRYARHPLEIDEVGEHIRAGKLPTALAMTWHGRVSFVLSETLALKKIKLLDVVLEGASNGGESQGDRGFDADTAIVTGELQQLLPELVDALGGLHAFEGASSPQATPAGAAAASEAPGAPAAASSAPGKAADGAADVAPWDTVAA